MSGKTLISFITYAVNGLVEYFLGANSNPKLSSVSFMQSSGYKPAPLDLSYVKLTPNQNTLVERLAENGHNVWARDRVRQGWTYSIVQVPASLL